MRGGLTTIIGRNDSMVKIRGYTVYLSAIEETLRKHCDAADAAVLAENEDEANKRLVAYVVRGAAGGVEDRWEERHQQRPARSAGTASAALHGAQPLHRTGDAPDKSTDGQTGAAKHCPHCGRRDLRLVSTPRCPSILARVKRRRALRELWSEALEVDGDSLEDDWNFFDLGGNSLTGLDLTLGIEQLFGIELSGTEIYEYPTISELGAYLENRGPNMESRISLAEDSILDPTIAPGRRPENNSSQRGVLGPCDGNDWVPGSLSARRTGACRGTGHPVLLPGKGPGLRTGRVHQPGAGHPEILRAGRSFCGRPDCPGVWRPHPAQDGSGQ